MDSGGSDDGALPIEDLFPDRIMIAELAGVAAGEINEATKEDGKVVAVMQFAVDGRALVLALGLEDCRLLAQSLLSLMERMKFDDGAGVALKAGWPGVRLDPCTVGYPGASKVAMRCKAVAASLGNGGHAAKVVVRASMVPEYIEGFRAEGLVVDDVATNGDIAELVVVRAR